MQQIKAQARRRPWDEHPPSVVAVRAETGEVLWRNETKILPLTLTVDDRRVFFHDGEKMFCLNRQDGEQKWQSESIKRRASDSPCPNAHKA